MKFLPLLLIVLLLGIENCDVKEEIDKAFIEVSGNVSDDGSAVAAAIILLLDSPNLTDGTSLSNGSLTGSNGDYTIINVKDGDYYVIAIVDVDGNLEFDPEVDRFGFHGVDPSTLDLLPDQITVAGEDVENIDITNLAGL